MREVERSSHEFVHGKTGCTRAQKIDSAPVSVVTGMARTLEIRYASPSRRNARFQASHKIGDQSGGAPTGCCGIPHGGSPSHPKKSARGMLD